MIFSKLADFETKVQGVNAKFKDIDWAHKMHSEMINIKAEKTDVKKVEKMLAHFTPLHEFKVLEGKLNEYTKNDEFFIAQKNISDIRDEMILKADAKETSYNIHKLSTGFDVKLKKYVFSETFNEEIERLYTKIEFVGEKIANANEDLKDIKNYSDIMENKLKAKIDAESFKSEVSKIWANFSHFGTQDEMDDLQAQFSKKLIIFD